MKPTVKCPTCSEPVVWEPSSAWRPFCSERCKLLDLGDWFAESNTIPESDWSEQQPGSPWPTTPTVVRNDDDEPA